MYRPISNLSFVFKLIERVFAARLNDNLSTHGLNETFRTAYEMFYSTEQSLLRDRSDLIASSHG